MRVLRSNKDSVMAMLEAFVHDPLINWRLLHPPNADHPEAPGLAASTGDVHSEALLYLGSS